MKDCKRKKTEANMLLKKIICLLMVAVLILPLTGTGFMRTYADNPTTDPAYTEDGWYSLIVPTGEESLSIGLAPQDYEGEAISFYDLPIVDVEKWNDDIFTAAYESIMPLSTLTLTVSHTIINNTTIVLTGSISNVGSATVQRRGFWLRRYDSDVVREISGGGGNASFSSQHITGLTPGGRYLFRSIAITPCYAHTHQSPPREVTMPTSPVNTPTPPPGGPTATPTPPPGGPTSTPTPPPGGPSPTPPPAVPFLTFSNPTFAAPWNRAEWASNINGGVTRANVNVSMNQVWGWRQSPGSEEWLQVYDGLTPGIGLMDAFDAETEIMPDGFATEVDMVEAFAQETGIMATSATGIQSGTQLSLRTQPNHTGVTRTATVTVTPFGGLPVLLVVTQGSVMTTVRGTRVIECFDRRGYVNVRDDRAVNVERLPGAIVQKPVWNFVHIVGNVFAIRNDTTGRYLTEDNRNLRHEPRRSGTSTNYSNNQRWLVTQEFTGLYRIRSISNHTLYLEVGPWDRPVGEPVFLASRNATHNRQLWRIGHIFHIDASEADAQDYFSFWGGPRIYIQTVPVGPQPPGFNFSGRMDTARSAWSSAIGVTFQSTTNRDAANIRAYGGHRRDIQTHIGRSASFRVRDFRYGVTTGGGGGWLLDGSFRGTMQAGGVTRGVNRMIGTGSSGKIMAVFTDMGEPAPVFNARSIWFATMTSMHELGHALGYNGHSPNRSDVMYGTIELLQAPNVTLSPAEIEHLRQIYQRFR